MTLPTERSRSIRKAREFLRDLLDPQKCPRIPKATRQEAYWVLRHFPTDNDINMSSKTCPDVWEQLKDLDNLEE